MRRGSVVVSSSSCYQEVGVGNDVTKTGVARSETNDLSSGLPKDNQMHTVTIYSIHLH